MGDADPLHFLKTTDAPDTDVTNIRNIGGGVSKSKDSSERRRYPIR
ncbi:hypothetical protein [Paracoccus indicus]|nr:hypothetical protein [Paracoccus indicus]